MSGPQWGGWITGPTALGPEQFAAAGYDYIGIDIQHGYLDDADAAVLLRRLTHVPIRALVRVPSADPGPIGRVLDAGADGIIVAMVDTPAQAAAAVAATRYPPRGDRSFGPLRPDLGSDPAALAARAAVFVMIETAAGLAAVEQICAVDGLTGIYTGPADLALSLGFSIPDALRAPEMLDAIDHIGATATAAGLVAGIHAGTGPAGRALAARGYTMLTLAAESQALRQGAADILAQARATTETREPQ